LAIIGWKRSAATVSRLPDMKRFLQSLQSVRLDCGRMQRVAISLQSPEPLIYKA